MNTYQVGKYYTVKVGIIGEGYYGNLGRSGEAVPIAGEPHDDADLGVKETHYHVDFRFVSASVWNALTQYGIKGIEHGQALWDKSIVRIETRRLLCKRDFNEWPTHAAPWYPKLVERYANTTAKHGRCPHKGYDMTTLPIDENNCVTCPLHGLKWDATTWKLKTPN